MFIIEPVDTFARMKTINVPVDQTQVYSPDATYAPNATCQVPSMATIYKNVSAASVTGKYPPDNLTSSVATNPWAEVGVVGAYAMFDPYINTRTTNPDVIAVDLAIGSCDALALFGVAATEVSLDVYDNDGSLVKSQVEATYEIVATIDDYFFTEPVFKSAVIVTFPLGIGGTGHLEIRNPGANAQCGMAQLGRKFPVGSTQDEVVLKFRNYSKITTDDLGRTKLKEGLVSDVAEFTLNIESRSAFHAARNRIMANRARNVVWCLDNTDETWKYNPSLMIYGYVYDADPRFRMSMSTIGLTVAGMV